jgi:hypothetical protein
LEENRACAATHAGRQKWGRPEVKRGQFDVKPVISPTDSGSQTVTHHTPSTPNQSARTRGFKMLGVGKREVTVWTMWNAFAPKVKQRVSKISVASDG